MIITHRYSIIIHIQIYGFQLPLALSSVTVPEKEVSLQSNMFDIDTYLYIWLASPSIDGNSLSEKNARIEMKCLSPHMIQDNRDKTLTLPVVTRSTSQQIKLTMRLLVILLTTLLSLSVRGEEDVQAHSAVIESCGG